jgi:hypothetical protein
MTGFIFAKLLGLCPCVATGKTNIQTYKLLFENKTIWFDKILYKSFRIFEQPTPSSTTNDWNLEGNMERKKTKNNIGSDTFYVLNETSCFFLKKSYVIFRLQDLR